MRLLRLRPQRLELSHRLCQPSFVRSDLLDTCMCGLLHAGPCRRRGLGTYGIKSTLAYPIAAPAAVQIMLKHGIGFQGHVKASA